MLIDPLELQRAIELAPRPDAPSGPAHRRSAVFILLANRERTNLLLIRRADRGDPWSNHIAFPGGHIAASDANALEAAYRETFEEVGIGPQAIAQLGDLGHFQTGTHRVDLHAFVGLWDGAGPLRPDPVEVAQVIEVPLGWLLSEHCSLGFALRGAEELGQELVYSLPETVIWGVTARIIHHLLGLVSTLTAVETPNRG